MVMGAGPDGIVKPERKEAKLNHGLRAISVHLLAKIQERPHPGGHVPPPPPDQPHPRLHRRLQRDAYQLRQLPEHTLVEKAAALPLPKEFQDGGDLAAAHNDVGRYFFTLKLAQEDLVLYGILVEQDQRLPLELFQGDGLLPRQRVGGANPQIGGFRGQIEGVKLIDVVELHIDQAHVQHIVLHQLAGPDGPVLLELHPDVRIDHMKGVQQVREEDGAEHGRDADAEPAPDRLASAVLGGQIVALAQDRRCPVIEDLPLVGEGQAAVGVDKQRERELPLQVPDRDGHRGLGDKENIGGLGDAVVPGRGTKIAKLCQRHMDLLLKSV